MLKSVRRMSTRSDRVKSLMGNEKMESEFPYTRDSAVRNRLLNFDKIYHWNVMPMELFGSIPNYQNED